MTLEKHLEDFRAVFPLHKVCVEDDYMTYKVHKGTAKRAAQEANEFILAMGLPLVAIANEYPFSDTFIIKSNETEL